MAQKRKPEKRKPEVLVNPYGAFYTTDQAAALLQISSRTILRAIDAGRIKAKRIGRGYRITKEELDRYVAEAPDRAR